MVFLCDTHKLCVTDNVYVHTCVCVLTVLPPPPHTHVHTAHNHKPSSGCRQPRILHLSVFPPWTRGWQSLGQSQQPQRTEGNSSQHFWRIQIFCCKSLLWHSNTLSNNMSKLWGTPLHSRGGAQWTEGIGASMLPKAHSQSLGLPCFCFMCTMHMCCVCLYARYHTKCWLLSTCCTITHWQLQFYTLVASSTMKFYVEVTYNIIIICRSTI